MDNELKPCPFCGGTDIRVVAPNGNDDYWAQCTKCCAESGVKTGRDAAIAAWNRRPLEAATRNQAIEECAVALEKMRGWGEANRLRDLKTEEGK
jgi:Lar family restriction alleviation protein